MQKQVAKQNFVWIIHCSKQSECKKQIFYLQFGNSNFLQHSSVVLHSILKKINYQAKRLSIDKIIKDNIFIYDGKLLKIMFTLIINDHNKKASNKKCVNMMLLLCNCLKVFEENCLNFIHNLYITASIFLKKIVATGHNHYLSA